MSKRKEGGRSADKSINADFSNLLFVPILLALIPLYWALNYALRTARSHSREDRKLKVKILDYFASNDEQRKLFLTEVKTKHSGQSNPLFSTDLSNKFDSDNESSYDGKAKDELTELKTYMAKESIFRGWGLGYNSGRTLFRTVMAVRSIGWMDATLFNLNNKSCNTELLSLGQAIIAKYKKSWNPSAESTTLLQGLQHAVKNQNASLVNTSIRKFLDTQTVQSKKNNENFSMLSIVEMELARVTYDNKSASAVATRS